MTMLDRVTVFALIMSGLNWLMFVGLTIWTDLPQLRKLFDEMLKPLTSRGARDVQQASFADAGKVAEATGSLAGAFKKAGAGPTAAAMSVLFFLMAVIAAGVAKF